MAAASSRPPDDPVAELRRTVRLARMVRRTPKLLRVPLGWIAQLGARIMIPLIARELPERDGFRVWISGPNADLYEQRLTGGLGILTAAAPVYRRWLHAGVTTLEVSVANRVAFSTWSIDYSTRLASFNPRFLFDQSTESVAFALGSIAIRCRLYACGVRSESVSGQRYRRIVLRRELRLARCLPNMHTEVERLQTQVSEPPNDDQS